MTETTKQTPYADRPKKYRPISIYLGENPQPRLDRLDTLAAEFGVSRSGLIALIADGGITLTRTAKRVQARAHKPKE